ncbi:MAG: ATP-binding protein [Campylobacter sp.]|nr:ATP-binding protein [Campylobacter sp.]
MSQRIDWNSTKAAIYRASLGYLRAVRDVDYVDIDLLIGIDRQKSQLIENTQNFINNKGFNHALLWGERGCGKSSLIKAVFTSFAKQNLRIIEIGVDDLGGLEQILTQIREYGEYKFIIFCDDLSFDAGDKSYKHLKPLLEGSIEKPPTNVVLYATSNRRHIVSESMSDNAIHKKEEVDEKLSLSDRFGLWISFYQGSFKEYLDIVDSYFKEYKGNRDELHLKARQYAMLRASRSGRVAKQFYESYAKNSEI